MALAFPSLVHAAAGGWPPEPLIEMRVQAAPTAFPSGDRTYLVYELLLTNLSKSTLGVSRIEVHDADRPSATPLTALESDQLGKVLQHFANPAVGDQIPEATATHDNLVAGETAIVFLTVVLERGVRIPDRLVHHLFTDDTHVEGAVVSSRAVKIQTLSPPLEGPSWRAFSGAGDNSSHHRRQMYVLGGHVSLSNRHAIDWKKMENDASSSGPDNVNSSYFSYGSRVLAVASGTVVYIKDGIPDNAPGHVGAEALKLTLETIAGNVIALDLGNGQFAYYAHLQPGSLRVKLGQRVRRGDVLALVGNSGSSFEPHLHFEVTTSPTPLTGEGLPYLLDEYEVVNEGATEKRRAELPLKGTTVNFPLER